MSMIKTSDLRQLDVINIEEGRYLGSVCDLDVHPETGKVLALIVDEVKPFRFLWRQRHEDLEIPWRDVIIVGIDVIVVKNRIWKR